MLPAPRSTRELLELLRFYDRTWGLTPLLDRIDFSDVQPLQIYLTALGRLPESVEMAAPFPPESYSARQNLWDAVLSEEFQRGIVIKLLTAFPEKSRLLFVHIPKCAGSDLANNLANRYPYLAQRLSEPDWTPREKFLDEVKQLSLELPFSDKIFIHGHFTLSWFASNKLLRHGDHMFTVLRDPVDRVISQINYILTRFSEDPYLSAPDTRDWVEVLGRDTIPRVGENLDVETLKSELLRHPRISHANLLCLYLGDGDAESALKSCVVSNIELTTLKYYERWLAERWGINRSQRENASEKFVSLNDFTEADKDFLHSITAEDQKIFDAVNGRLAERDVSSIHGLELAMKSGTGLPEERRQAELARSDTSEIEPVDVG